MMNPVKLPRRLGTTLACAAFIVLAGGACEADDILPPGTPTGSGTVASQVGPWLGHEQKVAVGTQTTIAVRVADIYDRPVSGVTVSFVASDGALGAATATSDGSGIASTTFMTSAAAKADTITATIPGAANPALVVVDATSN
jgi:hypothetical protein